VLSKQGKLKQGDYADTYSYQGDDALGESYDALDHTLLTYEDRKREESKENQMLPYFQIDFLLDEWVDRGIYMTIDLGGDDIHVTKLTNLVRTTRQVTSCGKQCFRVQASLVNEAEIQQLHTADGGPVQRRAIRLRALGEGVHVINVRCGIPPPAEPPPPPRTPPLTPPIVPPDYWLLPSPPPMPPPTTAQGGAGSGLGNGASGGLMGLSGSSDDDGPHQQSMVMLGLASGAVPLLAAVLIIRAARSRQQKRTRKVSAKSGRAGGGGEASRAWNRPRPKSFGYKAARAQAAEECGAAAGGEEEEDTEEEGEEEDEVVEPLVPPLPQTNAKGKGHTKDTGRKDKGRRESHGAAAAAKKDKKNELASLEAEIAELAQRERTKQGASRESSRATRQKESRPAGTRARVPL